MHFDGAGKAPRSLQRSATLHLLGTGYIQVHPAFFQLQEAAKCQARGSAEGSVFIMFPSFIFFPVGDRKGNCFGDHLSQWSSINTFPLCLFFLCCYECFSSVTLMPLEVVCHIHLLINLPFKSCHLGKNQRSRLLLEHYLLLDSSLFSLIRDLEYRCSVIVVEGFDTEVLQLYSTCTPLHSCCRPPSAAF